MFDFEKFKTHKKAEDYCLHVRSEIRKTISLARFERDQLGRCSLSVVANIAEGNSIYGGKSRANYFRIARASLAETVSIIRILQIEGQISNETYSLLYEEAEEVSKMLSSAIRNLKR